MWHGLRAVDLGRVTSRRPNGSLLIILNWSGVTAVNKFIVRLSGLLRWGCWSLMVYSWTDSCGRNHLVIMHLCLHLFICKYRKLAVQCTHYFIFRPKEQMISWHQNHINCIFPQRQWESAAVEVQQVSVLCVRRCVRLILGHGIYIAVVRGVPCSMPSALPGSSVYLLKE